MTERERIARIALEVIDSKFDAACPDWWPSTEEWADEIARRVTEQEENSNE